MKPAAKQGFFWQGLLILLPAILLAALGLYSLRQDRALAEHDIRSLAENLARQWNESVIPTLLTPRGTIFEQSASSVGENGLGAELESPLSVVFDPKGGLLYPPPALLWPPPMPEPELPPDLQPFQATARAAEINRDWSQAAAAWERVLAWTEAPPAVSARVRLAWAGSMQQSGQPQRARIILEKLLPTPLEIRGAAGLPVAALAGLRLLQSLPDGSEGSKAVDALGAAAIRNPSRLSETLLSEARTIVDTHTPANRAPSSESTLPVAVMRLNQWDALWRRHENLRALTPHAWAALQNASNHLALQWIINLNNAPLLFCARSDPEWRCGIWSEERLRQSLQREQKAQGWPADCALVLRVAGREVLGGNAVTPEMALARQTSGNLDWEIAVHLSDPDSFYARQRWQSLRLGVVIALGLGTVFIGFFAARRAFYRQAALGEMKTNFVSSVSHELRAPIAAVRLLAEELSDHTPLERAKAKEYHRLILTECRRLSGLIDNVLDFSRNEQGRKQYLFEPTDLGALVQATSELMRPHAEDRAVTLRTEIPQGEAWEDFEADGAALQQVLVNLLDNAIKHAPAQSEVWVRLQREGGEAVIRVADQGEGISIEERQKVFERFYRCGSELTRKTPGVGLGLAIAKYIVEAHQGRIGVESAMGAGSVFWVRLPLRDNSRGGAKDGKK